MKKFKKTDAWTSVVLIVAFAIVSIIYKNYSFILGYFVVGGWQVISMLVHIFSKRIMPKNGRRNFYHWVTLIALITMPVGSFWVLLFTAPFMAVYYTWLCFDELHALNQRPLAMLK